MYGGLSIRQSAWRHCESATWGQELALTIFSVVTLAISSASCRHTSQSRSVRLKIILQYSRLQATPDTHCRVSSDLNLISIKLKNINNNIDHGLHRVVL